MPTREPTPRPNFAFDVVSMAGNAFTRWLMVGTIAYAVWDQIPEFDWRYALCIGIALKMGAWTFFSEAYRRYGDEMGRLPFARKLSSEMIVQAKFALTALYERRRRRVLTHEETRDVATKPVEEPK